MGMTMTEKILARHAGLPVVKPGELVTCQLDMVLANDITAPPAIKVFNAIGKPVFDATRIALVPDHYQPAKDIKSAELAQTVRQSLREWTSNHVLSSFCPILRLAARHSLVL